jgi:hypothetical protein
MTSQHGSALHSQGRAVLWMFSETTFCILTSLVEASAATDRRRYLFQIFLKRNAKELGFRG